MISFGYQKNPQNLKKGVIDLKEKKEFVEPEMVKCEESLDKVTLCFNQYHDNDEKPPCWRPFGRGHRGH
jgi:hypothetical protein